jgi:hypothetical protein
VIVPPGLVWKAITLYFGEITSCVFVGEISITCTYYCVPYFLIFYCCVLTVSHLSPPVTLCLRSMSTKPLSSVSFSFPPPPSTPPSPPCPFLIGWGVFHISICVCIYLFEIYIRVSIYIFCCTFPLPPLLFSLIPFSVTSPLYLAGGLLF